MYTSGNKKNSAVSATAHAFANFQNVLGRKAENLFVDQYGNKGNSVIYSYGKHFPIASHIYNDMNEAGNNLGNGMVTLFTTRTHSVTTAKHKSIVLQALNTPVILCDDIHAALSGVHIGNLEKHVEALKNANLKMIKARNVEPHLPDVKKALTNMRDYISLFGLHVSETYTFIINEIAERVTEVDAMLIDPAYIAKQVEKKSKAVKTEEQKIAKSLIDWRNFKTGRLIRNNTGFAYLRYNVTDKAIETSQAITIPYAVALRYFIHINAVIAKGGCNGGACGEMTVREGYSYAIKEINAYYVIVGCHKVRYEEIVNVMIEANRYNANGAYEATIKGLNNVPAIG